MFIDREDARAELSANVFDVFDVSVQRALDAFNCLSEVILISGACTARTNAVGEAFRAFSIIRGIRIHSNYH